MDAQIRGFDHRHTYFYNIIYCLLFQLYSQQTSTNTYFAIDIFCKSLLDVFKNDERKLWHFVQKAKGCSAIFLRSFIPGHATEIYNKKGRLTQRRHKLFRRNMISSGSRVQQPLQEQPQPQHINHIFRTGSYPAACIAFQQKDAKICCKPYNFFFSLGNNQLCTNVPRLKFKVFLKTQ